MYVLDDWMARQDGTGMVWNGNIGQLRLQFVAMIGYIYDTHKHVI